MVMRVVTFKIEEDLLETLDLYAKSKNMARSEVIRQAIIRYLINTKKIQYIEARRIRVWK